MPSDVYSSMSTATLLQLILDQVTDGDPSGVDDTVIAACRAHLAPTGKPAIARKVAAFKDQIANHFLRNSDPETWDRTMSDLVQKLDALEAELHRPDTFMGEPFLRQRKVA